MGYSFDTPAIRSRMDLPEAGIHSFVVRIWLEEEASEAQDAVWRGHITHIPSGERRYIQQLRDLHVFITPYLEAMGVRSGTEDEKERGRGRTGGTSAKRD